MPMGRVGVISISPPVFLVEGGQEQRWKPEEEGGKCGNGGVLPTTRCDVVDEVVAAPMEGMTVGRR